MRIAAYGIGWAEGDAMGALGRGLSIRRTPEAERDSFQHPFKNYSRLDGASRDAALASALALADAGVSYPFDSGIVAGMAGAGPAASLSSDIEYFMDYLDNGRILGRANLFIYTLPTSPLAEASIHFGLLGPCLYLSDAEGEPGSALAYADRTLRSGAAHAMLLAHIGRGRAACALLAPEGSSFSARAPAAGIEQVEITLSGRRPGPWEPR